MCDCSTLTDTCNVSGCVNDTGQLVHVMHFRSKLNAQASTAFTITVTHWLPLILLLTNSAICVRVTVWLMQSWCMQAKQNESKYTGTSSNDLKDNAFSSKSHDSGFGSKSSSFGEQPYTSLSTLCQMVICYTSCSAEKISVCHVSWVMCHGLCVYKHLPLQCSAVTLAWFAAHDLHALFTAVCWVMLMQKMAMQSFLCDSKQSLCCTYCCLQYHHQTSSASPFVTIDFQDSCVALILS